MLVPYLHLSSFIRDDLATLSSRYEVRAVPCRSPLALAKALLALRRSDAVFCWFGSIRFLPLCLTARLLGKPVVIVAGGYDVANLPEIEYGNMRPGPTRWLGRWLFRSADLVLPFSRAGSEEASSHAGVPATRQQIIYLGFDSDRFGGSGPPLPKERMVLTVAGIDASTIHRKGLLTVAATSRLLPDVPFVIAGRFEPGAAAQLKATGGPNLVLKGFVTDEELQRLYARARVYLQPSVHEAFGCSVAEAMLHGCIPVVTRRFSLPEVVGPCGYYVAPGDPAGAAAAVRLALQGTTTFPETGRSRIVHAFPAERRRAELLRALDGLFA